MITGLVVVFLCLGLDKTVFASTFPDTAVHPGTKPIIDKTGSNVANPLSKAKLPSRSSLMHFRRAKPAPSNIPSSIPACMPDEQHENPPVPLNYSQTTSPALTETSFIAECDMPTEFGHFRMRSYTHLPIQTSLSEKIVLSELNYKNKKQRFSLPNERILEPVVLVYGNITAGKPVLLRVHDQCITSEVFHSLRCDCREQLWAAMKDIVERVDGKRLKGEGEEGKLVMYIHTTHTHYTHHLHAHPRYTPAFIVTYEHVYMHTNIHPHACTLIRAHTSTHPYPLPYFY